MVLETEGQCEWTVDFPPAVPDTLDPFGFYIMDELADYPPPIRFHPRQISNSPITDSTRVVCYTQNTYDDDRQETTEYFRLTLIIETRSKEESITLDPVFGHTIFAILDNDHDSKLRVIL